MAEDKRKQCASASSCPEESCEGCPGASGGPQSLLADLNKYSSIKKVIAVVSGKGGVGKSFVTASLASAMRKKGYKVGILDADITGPSIPKMYGLKGPATGNDMGVYPIEAKNGIKVMSVNLLMEDETQPVVWRGPIIAGTVKQFWTDVVWGELDYLFVDMPPGTGDVPLTVFQSLPVDGIVIVTSPQELVQMIVKKAYNMAAMMKVPVLGVVENFSYLTCPDCGRKISIFGESHVEEAAADIHTKVLGRLPINPAYAQLADEGRFDEVDNENLADAVSVISDLIQ